MRGDIAASGQGAGYRVPFPDHRYSGGLPGHDKKRMKCAEEEEASKGAAELPAG